MPRPSQNCCSILKDLYYDILLNGSGHFFEVGLICYSIYVLFLFLDTFLMTMKFVILKATNYYGDRALFKNVPYLLNSLSEVIKNMNYL